jgi:HSP20 family protein
MKALMPTGMTSLRKEMDRLFDRFWDGDLEFTEVGEWRPVMDVSETKETLNVKVEVPGIEPKNVHVLLENGMLTIKGEKKQEVEEKDERFYRMERCSGTFMRALRLPVPVDATKVKAVFTNGVLTITLPKVAEAKGTTIPIRIE